MVYLICELREAIKQPKNRKYPRTGPNTRRIFKACRERSKNLNMYAVSKNLGNRISALTLEKKKKIVPILKTGKDPKSTASYRPISLTSMMEKCMERIINSRLNWLLKTNNFTANDQAGFRIHRSTSERTATFSQYIMDALDDKRTLTAVFIDIKSAYDSVWKENLLLTLSNPIFLPPTYSPALIYFGLERGWWITCLYYMRKRVGQAPTAEQNKCNKKKCRTSSDIGVEQENHNVGQVRRWIGKG
jgi:hypothetical protein